MAANRVFQAVAGRNSKQEATMPGNYYLYPFQTGAVLQLKKKHPCGSWLWQIQRVGADISLKCMTCGHLVTMPRQKLEKAVKSVKGPDAAE